MRFLTTTRPPAGILDHDLGIEWAPPVFFRRDPGDAEEAGAAVAAQILDAIRQGARSVTLRDWANETVHPAADRDWWDQAVATIAKILSDTEPIAVAVDHARYQGRRAPDEIAWQRSCLAPLAVWADRWGVYGHHGDTPTVWTSAADYAWLPHYDVEDIAWLLMPGQHRPSGSPPTVLEFAGVVDEITRTDIDTVCVWSDPGLDQFGRWKTRPDHWHALLVVAALVRGRRLDVPKIDPPSWLPPVEPAPQKTPPRSGPGTTKVFAASLEEVQP